MRSADLGRIALVDDDPRSRPLSSWLVRMALAIPCAYHGAWNVGDDGAAWWTSSSGLPASLRFVVGAAEIAAAIALVSGVLSRVAAVGLVVVFAGAIPQHVGNGFSFKHGGYEPLVAYALIALAIVFTRNPRTEEQPRRET